MQTPRLVSLLVVFLTQVRARLRGKTTPDSPAWMEAEIRKWSRRCVKVSPNGGVSVDPSRMPVSREQAERSMERLRRGLLRDRSSQQPRA
jgi:hypothetical protein